MTQSSQTSPAVLDEVAAPLLVLSKVSRSYSLGGQSVIALDGVDLSIKAGEFVAIVGPSGSGKSTLLNIIGCLDRPTSGVYSVEGRETGALGADALAALRRHTFGFVFQGYNLLPRLDAGENVQLPASYANEASGPRRARAAALLARLGLEDRIKHRPAELSGGQQQRVGIARAMMNGGTVILADEPTGALDSRTGDEIMALFRTLCDDGHTVLIVTHDPGVAARADRILEIADGRIQVDRTLRDRPAARFLSETAPSDGSLLFQLQGAIQRAARTIAINRLRNILTMLGIIAGIASVILSVALGEGSQKQVLSQIGRLGTNLTMIQAGSISRFRYGGPTPDTLSNRDVERLSDMPFLTGATPSSQRQVGLHLRNRVSRGYAYGVNASFFRIFGMPVVAGRLFTDNDIASSALSIVIGVNVQAQLFDRSENPIGTRVMLSGLPVRIIGVVAPPLNSRYSEGNFIALPRTTFEQRVSGRTALETVFIGMRESYDRSLVLAAVKKLLRAWHGSEDFIISDFEQVRQAMLRTKLILNIVTGSIAAIALIVAGIGVTNMMLVSVVERTREIGILMAIGARRGDILLQFLFEAVLICLGGGLLGTMLAFGVGSAIVASGTPVALAFSWRAVAVAVISSTVAGLLAGLLPARRAARIDPIDALAR